MNFKKIKNIIIAATLVAGLTLTGCSGETDTPKDSNQANQDKKY